MKIISSWCWFWPFSIFNWLSYAPPKWESSVCHCYILFIIWWNGWKGSNPYFWTETGNWILFMWPGSQLRKVTVQTRKILGQLWPWTTAWHISSVDILLQLTSRLIEEVEKMQRSHYLDNHLAHLILHSAQEAWLTPRSTMKRTVRNLSWPWTVCFQMLGIFPLGLLDLELVPLVPCNEDKLVDNSKGRSEPHTLTYYRTAYNIRITSDEGQSKALRYPQIMMHQCNEGVSILHLFLGPCNDGSYEEAIIDLGLDCFLPFD